MFLLVYAPEDSYPIPGMRVSGTVHPVKIGREVPDLDPGQVERIALRSADLGRGEKPILPLPSALCLSLLALPDQLLFLSCKHGYNTLVPAFGVPQKDPQSRDGGG